MTQPALEYVEAIAAALAMETRAACRVDALDHGVHTVQAERKRSLIWASKIRLVIFAGNTPQRWTVQARPQDDAVADAGRECAWLPQPRISVAASRSPQAVAREIARRLLPDARAVLARAEALYGQREALRARIAVLRGRAAAAMRAAGWDVQPFDGSQPQLYGQREAGAVRAEVLVREDGFRLELNVGVEAGLRILSTPVDAENPGEGPA